MYPVLERILDAAEAENMSVVLGLQHHPEYWDQIKGREKVIRDFFRVRRARNERLQHALLQAFGNREAWTGYYIPDEIDDLTWRTPEMRELIHTYLRAMTGLLRENDPDRFIAVSAFFRGRTAPDRVAEDLLDIMAGTDIDILLVQDGIGVGDPPLPYVPTYYEALTRTWTSESAGERGPLPALWCVIEAFKQISEPDEPFSAEPPAPDRLQEQIEAARPYFERLILFTFDDYLHPERGDEARKGFQALRDWTTP